MDDPLRDLLALRVQWTLGARSAPIQLRTGDSMNAEMLSSGLNPQPAPKPKRTRRPSKAMREKLAAEYQRGWNECLERDRGPYMLGLAIGAVINAAIFMALGAWWF